MFAKLLLNLNSWIELGLVPAKTPQSMTLYYNIMTHTYLGLGTLGGGALGMRLYILSSEGIDIVSL